MQRREDQCGLKGPDEISRRRHDLSWALLDKQDADERWRRRLWKEEHRGENYTATEVTVNIWTTSQWLAQEAGLPSALYLKRRPLYKPQVSSLPVDSTQSPPVQPSFNTTAFSFPPAPKAFSVRLSLNPHAFGAKPSSLARHSMLLTM